MTNGRGRVSLCGFPISFVTRDRPGTPRICPDCALAYVDASFPAENANHAGSESAEWFRQLPTPDASRRMQHTNPDEIKPTEA